MIWVPGGLPGATWSTNVSIDVWLCIVFAVGAGEVFVFMSVLEWKGGGGGRGIYACLWNSSQHNPMLPTFHIPSVHQYRMQCYCCSSVKYCCIKFWTALMQCKCCLRRVHFKLFKSTLYTSGQVYFTQRDWVHSGEKLQQSGEKHWCSASVALQVLL